jgi:hypothetical protein
MSIPTTATASTSAPVPRVRTRRITG